MPIKQFKLTALSAAVVMGLAACGGSDDNYAPTVSAEVAGEGMQWMGVQGQVNATDPNGDSLTYSASVVTPEGEDSPPGTVEISDDGSFVYTPMRAEPAVIDITVSDGELETSQQVTVENVNGDPLADQQWHLRNTGQTAFAMADSVFEAWRELRVAQGWTEEEAEAAFFFDESILVPGEDLNVIGAYQKGITGEGSISVVVDQGLAIDHEDLQENVLPGRSINLIPGARDRTDPTVLGDGGDHGTSVSGLIAAKGWNGLGGRGVSPNASLIGMNYLGGSGTQTDRNYMMVHGMAGSGISPSENIVTFNRSYGTSAPVLFATDEIDEEVISYPAKQLRNGLGALNIKSAGNSFSGANSYPQASQLCAAQQAGVVEGMARVLSCLDGNWDVGNASFYTISIGAVNTDGKRSSYSTAGSNLFVAAPAGEYGDTEPAMVTSDQTTCTRGYASWAAYDSFMATNGAFLANLGIDAFHERVYPFNNPMGEYSESNLSCNYTNTFNGTSSAAPNTSGVVNLIAEANPELSWREIRHILAETATQVDPDNAPIELTVGDGTFVAHQGWVENAAGYSFNNLYGFGRPDAGAAVELAMSDSVELPELIETEWLETVLTTPVAVPDNNAEGVSIEITVEEDVAIEGVQFGLSVRNQAMADAYDGVISGTTAGSDIAIEVTSPAGTKSVIATSRTSLGAYFGIGSLGGNLDHIYHPSSPLLTNAFLGESSAGTWTVRVIDTNGQDRGTYLNNTENSLVDQVNVRLFGH
ncbi:proprotein convertase P-domain-containing protein [Idiomarina loihiensis]|uniref:S8 family serine peptidase n=1 Tax=Idiomarina TaxID=135575 RepID=UPI000D70D9BD|nr:MULTISPECIES: S8 family serine peptidase [Idiomarina]PWW36974.1 proprotein convertase P-domain-containing protein [Idiomarina loihiensis]TDP46782.1 proprotein convertase P-domain-containing protein [Idiomarina loihiensis]TDS23053.1 proprotein convertase P-domain-containing protein [Idiomarina sp. H2]